MPRAKETRAVRKLGRPSKADVLARTQGALALAAVAAGPKLVPVLVLPEVAELLTGMPADAVRRLILDAARRGLAKL